MKIKSRKQQPKTIEVRIVRKTVNADKEGTVQSMCFIVNNWESDSETLKVRVDSREAHL